MADFGTSARQAANPNVDRVDGHSSTSATGLSETRELISKGAEKFSWPDCRLLREVPAEKRWPGPRGSCSLARKLKRPTASRPARCVRDRHGLPGRANHVVSAAWPRSLLSGVHIPPARIDPSPTLDRTCRPPAATDASSAWDRWISPGVGSEQRGQYAPIDPHRRSVDRGCRAAGEEGHRVCDLTWLDETSQQGGLVGADDSRLHVVLRN